MKLINSLRGKLILYFVTLAISAIAISGIYSFYHAQQAIVNRTFEQLKSVRTSKKQQLEQFFNQRLFFVQNLSKNGLVENFIADFQNINIENVQTDSLQTILKPLQQLSLPSSAEWLVICNKESNAAKISFSEEMQTVHTELIKSENFYSFCPKNITQHLQINEHLNSTTPAIEITAVITGTKKQKTGTISLFIPFSELNRMVAGATYSGLGESGEAYIVGKDGLMRTSSRFSASSIFTKEIKTPAFEKANQGIDSVAIIQDYRHVEVLSAFGPVNVPDLSWILVAEIDLAEAMIPVYIIRNRILFISIFIAIIVIFIGFTLSKRITYPVEILKNATLTIGKGQFDTAIPIKTGDEMAELAKAFERMAAELQQQTQKLREREKRLQHFYEATKDGIILHDNGNLILVNQALSQMTYFSVGELKQKTIAEIIEKKNTETNECKEQMTFYETVAFRKAGRPFPVEIQESCIEYYGRKIKAVVIRDISRRREVEKALAYERQKRLSAVIDGQEMERQRLSRELHDGLGQTLIAIKLKLESLLNSTATITDELMDEIRRLFNSTIDEIRRMSNNLMPSALHEFGLVTALGNLCNDISEHTPLNVIFDSENVSENYSERIKTYIFRIVQEALNNAVKHAHATEVIVTLIEKENTVNLTIEDNGGGFNFDKEYHKGSGSGLFNMRERVNLLNGIIYISSRLGAGTIISVRLPLGTEH